MEINIVKADDGSFVDQVKASLQWCRTAYIGVAYARYNAFELLKPQFEQFLRRNGKLRLIFDIERFITDREIIEEFATIPGDSECKVFIKSKPAQKANPHLNYHPKSYLFFDDNNYHVIIGSSNLSLGGLAHNIECNLSVRGPKGDALFEEVSGYFLNTWNMEYMVNVLTHGELLNEYRVLFKESEKEDRRKDRRISQLRGSLDKKVDTIIKSQKKILNENFSYLLGLISANSTFDRAKKTIEIDLYRKIANSGKPYQGFYHVPEVSEYKISQYDAHLRDVERIVEKLSELKKIFKTDDQITYRHAGGYRFKVLIEFDDNSAIFKELSSYEIPSSGVKVIPFVPKNIFKSSDKKIIISFLRGYCDLKSRISLSDGIYKKKKGKGHQISSLRMGISIPNGRPELLELFRELLAKIGVKKGASFLKREDREHLIRIDVRRVPYQLLGTHWKRIFLSDFKKFLAPRTKAIQLR